MAKTVDEKKQAGIPHFHNWNSLAIVPESLAFLTTQTVPAPAHLSQS